VAYWNLSRLAQALSPLFADVAPLQAGLAAYQSTFVACTRRDAAAKLGLAAADDDDLQLYQRWQQLMQDGAMDMTLAWRALMRIDPAAPDAAVLDAVYYDEARRRQCRRRCSTGCRTTRAPARDPLSASERQAKMARPTRCTCCATGWPRKRSTAQSRATSAAFTHCRTCCATRTPSVPAGALRRQAPGVGRQPRRLLDAVLQFLRWVSAGLRPAPAEASQQPEQSWIPWFGGAVSGCGDAVSTSRLGSASMRLTPCTPTPPHLRQIPRLWVGVDLGRHGRSTPCVDAFRSIRNIRFR
jgi:hypothetical protein